MTRKVIVVGDTTTSGGEVIGGISFCRVDGIQIARVGDLVSCSEHKGIFPIVTGDARFRMHGQAVAREHDQVACGCTLVSVRQSRMFIDNLQAGGAVHGASLGMLADGVPSVPTGGSPMAFSPSHAAAPEAAQPAPIAVTLRIGVFFDGTNNNAANVAQGQQCRASTGDALGQDDEEQAAMLLHCKPFMLKAGSSYDNGTTNVARLYELYRDNTAEPAAEDATECALRIYVPGIGTATGEADSKLSQGLGIGRSGVAARVEEAFESLIPEEIEVFCERYPDKQVNAIEFDVFGFSRGATAARHFVRLVNRGQEHLAQAVLNRGIRYAEGFELAQAVRVGFVGLFDSVAAIGSLADGFNIRGPRSAGLDLFLPAGSARQVVHLVARDEKRANFMLTSVAPPHRDLALPGVHSDLGGGYHGEREGPKLLTKPVGFQESSAGLVPGQTPGPHLMERSRAHALATADAERWRAWFGLSEREVRVATWHLWQSRRPAGSSSVQMERVLRIYAAVVLEREVDWRYQLIPLRVMHARAMEAGVPFDFMDENDPNLTLPQDLRSIADKLLADQPLDEQEESLLRRKYLHQSAHWNFARVRNPVSLDLLYINRPDPKDRRGVFPNQ